jgi:hypothetical protein
MAHRWLLPDVIDLHSSSFRLDNFARADYPGNVAVPPLAYPANACHQTACLVMKLMTSWRHMARIYMSGLRSPDLACFQPNETELTFDVLKV